MKFDIDTASDEEKYRFLDAKIFDAATGDEVGDLAAFDTKTGWRRQYVIDTDRPDRVIEINGKLVNLGKNVKLVEILGNPLRIEFPQSAAILPHREGHNEISSRHQ